MIVDASVALKWLVRENDSERARSLIEQGGLIAPDLIGCELSNAIWKKLRRGELSEVPRALGTILDVFDTVEPTAGYVVRATEIAFELGHAAYDCFYLALAEATGELLVTADTRFLAKLEGSAFVEATQSLHQATS